MLPCLLLMLLWVALVVVVVVCWLEKLALLWQLQLFQLCVCGQLLADPWESQQGCPPGPCQQLLLLLLLLPCALPRGLPGLS